MLMLQTRKNNSPFDIFDSIFDDPFFAPSRSMRRMPDQRNMSMRCDITQEGDDYIIDVDLPGYQKEDVSVELKNGYLMITATKNEEKEEKEKNYIHRERFYGSCSRNFYVGENVSEENIKASFKDGILKLTIPKVEETKVEQKLISIE